MSRSESQPKFKTREEVDFVIVGSGTAGGVLARELSTNGFSVVVLEQGQYRTAADFKHDEMDVLINNGLMNHPGWNDPQTFRKFETETAVQKQGDPPPAYYARGVGGSSVHFTANYWRFHQSDLMERSLLGPMEGGTIQAHLLGTCRMGNDPATSVVDKYHRAHDVPNLFICDGSSFVSSGRGQPTMTIQALAFRAAEHITRFARNGEI